MAQAREQEIRVKLVGDASQLSSTFRKSNRDADTFGGKMKLLGRSMQQVIRGDFAGAQKSLSQMGSKFAIAGAAAAVFAAGVVVAAYKIGRAFYDIGAAWDRAYDTIRIGTGATGAALESLQRDTQEIAGNTASALGDIGGAVASLNTRLGLTGKPLQKLAKQFLDFSRMTGGNAQQDVRLITRLFGDWGVATEDYGTTLDMVFRTLQASDISMQDLAGTVVQYGAVLRQLGFPLEDSLAMLGKWEKEGVNAQTAITGLRYALKTFGREGIPPVQGFERAFNKIKNADSEVDAVSEAFRVFGLRAGSDVAAAIREGRFAWEDMKEYVTEGKDTINKAASDTEDFREKWQILKNRLMKKFEPVAMRVFDKVTDAADWMVANEDAIVSFFGDVARAAEATFKFVAKLVDALEWLDQFSFDFSTSESQVLGRMKGWDSLFALKPSSLTTYDQARKKMLEIAGAINDIRSNAARGLLDPADAAKAEEYLQELQDKVERRMGTLVKSMHDAGGRGGIDASKQMQKRLDVPVKSPRVKGAAEAGGDAGRALREAIQAQLRKELGVTIGINFNFGSGAGLPGGGFGGIAAGMKAVSFAKAQLGDSYRVGATGPDAWDCSGLAMGAYRAAGLSNFPTYTGNQWVLGRQVPKRSLLPGDQIFMRTNNPMYTDAFGWGHTGIYIGGGQMIHAAGSRSGVIQSPVGAGYPWAARRHFAAAGADFMTAGPTILLAGEAGREHVKVTPAPVDGASGGLTVNFNGDLIGVDATDLAHQVAAIISRSQRSRSRGVAFA